MRILYHHRTLGDGAEGIHVSSMVEAWRALGHDVRVAALIGQQTNVDTQRTRRLTSVRHVMPKSAYELMEFGYSAYGGNLLRREVANWQPDVIYERYTLYNLAGVSVARLARLPLILEVNAPLAYERARYERLFFRRAAGYCERLVCRRATTIVVVSTPLKEYLIAEGVPEDRIVVLPNGADSGLFRPNPETRARLRQDLRIPPDTTVVGFAGILRPWHGVDLLLDAIARLHARRVEVRVLIVGDGPSQSALQDWVHERNLDSTITFTGRVSHEQIPDYLAALDIGISPKATFYASPMKVSEYMATGLAVVAPRMPNLEDLVVDGQTGLLFTPEDPGDLAHAIERLAHDRSLVDRLGKAARRAIDSGRTWNHNAARVVSLVTQLRTCA